jgi:tryptophan synthase alpha chain
MSRLAKCFEKWRRQRRCALVPYLTAGDPSPEVTLALMRACVAAGADVLELGIPFSDPMADGPVIQRASERALARGMTPAGVFDVVRRFRETDNETPLVLMGYLNPVEAMGYENFAERAARAGTDGVITVDLPPEEGAELTAAFARQGLDPVFLLAPTSTPERIARIVAAARGFVYYVSLRGVTGAGNLDLAEVRERLRGIKAGTALPVGVGFGIGDAATARAVAEFADAVIVGSAIMRRVEQAPDETAAVAAVGGFVRALREAMDKRVAEAVS